MQCMICKQEVEETADICSNCGAMPWKMPETFLNEEQHLLWLNRTYYPQMDRWNNIQQLHTEIDTLRKENSELNLRISQLENIIKIGSSENNSNNSNDSYVSTLGYYESNKSRDPVSKLNIHLSNKIIKKRSFLNALSKCILLSDYDKESVYDIIQSIFGSFLRYSKAIADIPPTKHGKAREEIINREKERLVTTSQGSTFQEALTNQITSYVSRRFSKLDYNEQQLLIYQILKAVSDIV